MGVVGRGGDRQHLADRLDPMRPTMIVNEGDHGLGRRPGSPLSKSELAFPRMSFARRSSRYSRSRAFSFSAISVGTPARCPRSTSAFLTQSCSVCGVQPILAAIDVTAAQREGCSPA